MNLRFVERIIDNNDGTAWTVKILQYCDLFSGWVDVPCVKEGEE